jgi:hypothetical protein
LSIKDLSGNNHEFIFSDADELEQVREKAASIANSDKNVILYSFSSGNLIDDDCWEDKFGIELQAQNGEEYSINIVNL